MLCAHYRFVPAIVLHKTRRQQPLGSRLTGPNVLPLWVHADESQDQLIVIGALEIGERLQNRRHWAQAPPLYLDVMCVSKSRDLLVSYLALDVLE